MPTDALWTSAVHPAWEAVGGFRAAQHLHVGTLSPALWPHIVRRSTHRARRVPTASRAHGTTGTPYPSSPLSNPCAHLHPCNDRDSVLPAAGPGGAPGTGLCSPGLGVVRGLGFGEAPPSTLGFRRPRWWQPCWWQQRCRVLRSLPWPVTASQAGWATGLRALGRGLTQVWGQDPQDPQTHCFCKPRA